jgi:cytosine deaminase
VTRLPPLRLPRCLLDPRCRTLPAADEQGLVAVAIEHREGRITALRPADVRPDAPLALALTPPVEPHAHLDKIFTAEAHPNLDGTMEEAMAANGREAAARSLEKVLERGERALELAWRQGLRAIRSHIDSIGPHALPSWEALTALRQRWLGRVELQLVALVPIRHWLSDEGRELARRVAAGGGLLGGVLGAPFPASSLDAEALLALLRLAEQHGCGVDLHIDESDEYPGRGLLLLQRLLAEQRMAVPLTCSHASSMGLMAERPLLTLAEGLAAAGVGVVALPTTNLWLLGKRPHRTPWRRPQAPIRQLQSAGVTVAIGGDNVRDPWFPGGDLDPFALLAFATVACHLAPWRRQGLAPLTSAAARLMGLDWDGTLRLGGPADLVVLAASSWPELLARPPRRRVLREGRWLPPPAAESASPLLADLPA